MLADRGIAVRFSSGAEDIFLDRSQKGFEAHTQPYFTYGALLSRMWPATEADYTS